MGTNPVLGGGKPATMAPIREQIYSATHNEPGINQAINYTVIIPCREYFRKNCTHPVRK